MVKLDQDKFTEHFSKLLNAFGKLENVRRDQSYYEYMAQFTEGQFQKIVETAISDSDKFPTISQLLRIAGDHGYMHRETDRDRVQAIAIQAWRLFEAAAIQQRRGIFDDAIAMKIIETREEVVVNDKPVAMDLYDRYWEVPAEGRYSRIAGNEFRHYSQNHLKYCLEIDFINAYEREYFREKGDSK